MKNCWILKLNNSLYTLLFVLLALVFLSQTQKGYYLFPIKPGEQNFLAGNMSEIRSNHFHTGLDIKTEGRQGLPVHASADGYVAKIKVSSFGYGNVLYLKHPNGTSTVYAHLKDFASLLRNTCSKKSTKPEKMNWNTILNLGSCPFLKGIPSLIPATQDLREAHTYILKSEIPSTGQLTHYMPVSGKS